MSINKGLFTSNTDLWATPQDFFDELNAEFGFDLDVCALPENAKCERYFTPEDDGLKQEWSGTVWCNPPYGRQIGKWVEKAYQADCTVVMLLPARTDTGWFHDYIYGKADIQFVRGRLKFGEAKNSAPFPSMVVLEKPRRSWMMPVKAMRMFAPSAGIWATFRQSRILIRNSRKRELTLWRTNHVLRKERSRTGKSLF